MLPTSNTTDKAKIKPDTNKMVKTEHNHFTSNPKLTLNAYSLDGSNNRWPLGLQEEESNSLHPQGCHHLLGYLSVSRDILYS